MHIQSSATLSYEKSTTWPKKIKNQNRPKSDTLTVKGMKKIGLESRVRTKGHTIQIGLRISKVSGKSILSNKRKKLSKEPKN